MNESQLLSQLTSGNGNSTATSGLGDLLSGLQSQIQMFFWIGIVSTVVLTIMFIIYLIHKMRVQSAILRIDKNVQRLVEAQVPVRATQQVPTQTPAVKTPENDIEQK